MLILFDRKKYIFQSKNCKSLNYKFPKNFSEEGDIVESKVPRNIDKSIYATNSDYNRKCVLCEKTSAEIISHYKNRHENDEVFISRPSPLMADKIRYQFDNFTSSTSKGLFKISGICYFCEQTHQMIMFDWKNHVLYHTGEMEFARSSFGHYSNKPIESELVGFMCRSCNYLQVNEDNLKKHMKNEHELSSNIENGYEKVTLLPDLRPVQIIKTNIELIEELDQYTCGIGWCDHKSKNILAFKAHLLESHDDMDENTRFGCLHCGKILTYNGKLFSGDMIEHLNLHGKHFYACLFCDVAHSTDMDMMLHLIQKHPMEKIKFHHLYRTDYLNSHTSEELTINLTCKECTNEFANITDAINHIQYQHGHRNIDLGTSKLSKRTSNGLTKISHSKNSMNVCQYYKCYICDEFRYNEYSLLKHFTNSHRQHSLILKPGEIYLTSSDNVINVNNSINNVFYCYHCYEMDCRYVGYVDCQDVFSHWSTTHCSKSFRFFYAEIIKCAHCNVIGTYQALKFHASREHANQQFATLKLSGRDECSLCQFAGENFDEHFQNEHYSIENVDIFCPIPLNDDKLNQLIKLKGQKKRRCQHCNYVFESRNDIESHHLIKHPQLKLSTQKFYDNESIHFITSCCQLKIASNDLFIHLKQHEFLTHCTDCSFKAKDFSEFENHHIDYHGDKYDPKQKYSEKLMDIFWRTKVVYGNGLVLNKHNLIGTKHDDSLIFATFIQDILREKKISFKA